MHFYAEPGPGKPACAHGTGTAKTAKRWPNTWPPIAKVERVVYCGLPGDPYHALAQKYLPNGSCGVVSFERQGRTRGGQRLYEGAQAGGH